MSQVVKFKGNRPRTIRTYEWAAMGFHNRESVNWNSKNNFAVPTSQFTDGQIAHLSSLEDFEIVEEQTSSEGGTTVVTAQPPAYAGSRTRPWDDQLKLYGGTDAALQPVRRALARALGGGRLVNAFCIGDSATAGAAAVPGTSDYVTRLRELLRLSGIPVTGAWRYPTNGMAAFDNAWSFVGTWQGRLNSSYNYVWTASATNNATLTGSGTTLEFVVFSNAAIGIQYQIDGGAVQTHTVVPNERNIVTVNGLTDGPHSVKINKAAGNSSTFWLGPGRFRGASGLSLSNAGISGSKASDWLPNAMGDVFYNPYSFTMELGATDLVIMGLGGNEIIGDAPATPADLTARLVTLGNAIKDAGSALIMRTYLPLPDDVVASTQGAGAEGSMAPWVSAIYDASDQLDVALIDQGAGRPSSAQLLAEGMFDADRIHPTAAGYALMARRDFEILRSVA